jgi:hypothetical protein
MQNCTNIINATMPMLQACIVELIQKANELQQQNDDITYKLYIKDVVGYTTIAYGAIMFCLSVYSWKKACDAAEYARESRNRIEALEARLGINANEINVTQESLNAENLLGNAKKKLPDTTDEEKDKPKKQKNKKNKYAEKETKECTIQINI